MGKEVKDTFIKVRIAKSEKDKVLAYCQNHGTTISELIRRALEVCFREEK